MAGKSGEQKRGQPKVSISTRPRGSLPRTSPKPLRLLRRIQKEVEAAFSCLKMIVATIHFEQGKRRELLCTATRRQNHWDSVLLRSPDPQGLSALQLSLEHGRLSLSPRHPP